VVYVWVYVWVCARVNDALAEVDGAHKRLRELDQGAPTPQVCVCGVVYVWVCGRVNDVGGSGRCTQAPE